MDEDTDLIRRYTQQDSEEAFAALVRRHVDLVYSTALRRTNGQRQLAEDATQQVFVRLARAAHSLQQHPTVAGWLYVAARHIAGDIARSEHSRKAREHEAHLMHTSSPLDSNVDWHALRPELEELMEELDARERDAIVLRFLQGRPFSEIGNAFRISEDAARMRVERALDKLRHRLEQRSIRSTGAALATALTAQAGVAAPAGLAASVTTAALASSTTAAAAMGTGAGLAAFGFMSTAKIMTTVTVLAGISAIGVAVYQARAAREDRTALAASVRQQESLRAKLRVLEAKGAAETKTTPAARTPAPVPETAPPPTLVKSAEIPPTPAISPAALVSAKEKLARIPNLARNGKVQDVEGIDESTVSAVRTWLKDDPQAAIQWLSTVPTEGNQRMHTIEALIAIELGSDPEMAFLLANGISSESARGRRLRDVLSVWASVDPIAAAKALQSADVSEQVRTSLLKAIERNPQPLR